MHSDYRDILGDVEIEETPGSFMPVLTPEMNEWLFDASVSLGNALGGGRICKRTYRTIQRVANAVSLFTPGDIVLPDGRQRATFSYREMAVAIGLDADSTRVVQQALRVLCLQTTSKDAATYRRAYELLDDERDGRPLLASLFLSNSRRLASAWELCGIRPRTFTPIEKDVGTQRNSLSTDSKMGSSVVSGRQAVAPSTSPVGISADIASATVDGKCENSGAPREALSCDVSAHRHSTSNGTVVDCADLESAASTTLGSCSLTTHSSLSHGDWLPRLCGLFQYQPGRREAETREAFDRLVGMGYAPRDLYDGAASYVARTPKDEQMRFPLKFLEDVSLIRGWCKAAPRTLDPAKLGKETGFWVYPFATGLEYVSCPPVATKEEAFEAVRRMVAEDGRRP